MPVYPFVSEYTGLENAFAKKLEKLYPDVCFDTERSSVTVAENAQPAFARAAAEFILTDLKKLEMERLARSLPFGETERKAAILCSEKYLNDAALLNSAADAVLSSLDDGKSFCPEAVLRFRLPFTADNWAAALDRAAEELCCEEDRAELYRLLGALLALTDDNSGGEARLVLYPDGSGVFSGRNGLRIECAPAAEAAIAGILCALSPMRLLVYDFAGSGRDGLFRSIRSLLGDRAVFFILNN